MTMQTTTGRPVDTWNLMRVGDLQGRTVVGRDDQEIGTIDDVYLDAEREVIEAAPEFDPEAGYDRTYESSVTTAWGVPEYWSTNTYGTGHTHWRAR